MPETIPRSRAKALGSALALLLTLGCGGGGAAKDGGGGAANDGGGAGSHPAGIARTATVRSLDQQQLAALCDWINASVGGYGSIDNCAGGGSHHADSDQQSCIGGFSGAQVCSTLTVGALEDCIDALGGHLCRVDTAPACASLTKCGPDGGTGAGG
jgi:hypothetical protein